MAQSQLLLDLFRMQWDVAPTVWLDTETTGTRVGFDRCVQVAVVRFDRGEPGASFSALINPGMPIPQEATDIHGITDAMVKDAMSLGEFFAHPQTIKLLELAQYAAYNASFDRYFIPPIGEDWSWPWADSLTLVRKVDRFERGKGRHKLGVACARHGIELAEAHSAGADARAAGQLFYKLGRQTFPKHYTMGQLLIWQRREEAEEWGRFMTWLSAQPPREAQP